MFGPRAARPPPPGLQPFTACARSPAPRPAPRSLRRLCSPACRSCCCLRRCGRRSMCGTASPSWRPLKVGRLRVGGTRVRPSASWRPQRWTGQQLRGLTGTDLQARVPCWRSQWPGSCRRRPLQPARTPGCPAPDSRSLGGEPALSLTPAAPWPPAVWAAFVGSLLPNHFTGTLGAAISGCTGGGAGAGAQVLRAGVGMTAQLALHALGE